MAATTPVYGSTGNAYLTYPSLTAFTTLAEAFSNKKNRETMELLITKMEAMKTSVDSLINNTNAKELKEAMDNLKNTIVSMGSSINSDAPTWEDIIDAIKRIPVENFTIPKDAEKKTYTLPEAYISWGDNLAYAYDVAKQFQDTIDLRGIIGEKGTYKGFYMIELSLDALTYVAGSNYYTLQVIRENSNGHFADAYMINGNRNSETNLIEWDSLSDYGTNEVKTFKIDLDDLPDNGKLFLFGLHFADEWDATILNNDQVKDRGKALILGGHPKRVITLSGCRYDEGIIQLNRTGEMVDHNLPDAVQSIREASLDTPYICVEDQQSEEKSLTFTGTVVKTDGTEVKNVTKTFLADGGIEQRSGSHYWYIVFDSDVASFKDFIIQDRYHTVRESRYETDASTGARVEIPYETGEGDYQWILDNDGYDIDLSTEYDHPGTTYSFASPITNDIYLRQARVPSSGSLNISSSGYIDKIHMPEYVAHTSGTIANSDSDLYELELPALKSNAGTIASSCGKLHELTLPSLETNSGTIASNDGNLYKLSLPNLKTSTGTIASGCSKLSVIETPEGGWHNGGTCITGTFAPNTNFTLGMETNSGTIASNSSTLKELHLPNLKTSTGTIASGCSNLSVLELDTMQHPVASLAVYGNSIETWYFPQIEDFISVVGSRGNGGNGCLMNGDKIKNVYLPNLRFCCGLNTGNTMGQLINGRNTSPIETIYLENLYCTGCGHPEEGWYTINRCPNLKKIHMPKLKYCGKNVTNRTTLTIGGDSGYSGFVLSCPKLEEILLPSCTSMVFGNFINGANPTKIVFGTLTEFMTNNYYGGYVNIGNKLMHFEVCADGGALKNSLSFVRWVPSEIDMDNNDMIEDYDICEYNYQQFLYNFRTYIVDRLYDFSGTTTKPTLTLSKTVFDIVFGLNGNEYANTWKMPNETDSYATSLSNKKTAINWNITYAT